MKNLSIFDLKKKAIDVRKDIVSMTHAAGSGHPGGSLSSVELMTALYFNVLNHKPDDSSWAGRDRFVLSKGHVCPLLYSVMAQTGYFPKEELLSLRKLGSRLQGHPDMEKLPGLELSCGSLGQGLSVAVGMALSFLHDKMPNRVYCLMGDGELNEGQIWEAVMTAAHYKLDNICGIVDVNGLQIDGYTKDVKDMEPFDEKFKSFNWHVIKIDGHNFDEVMAAYEKAKTLKGKPTVILAYTTKGKGISFMEDKAGWHGMAPSAEQKEGAIKELEESEKALEGD